MAVGGTLAHVGLRSEHQFAVFAVAGLAALFLVLFGRVRGVGGNLLKGLGALCGVCMGWPYWPPPSPAPDPSLIIRTDRSCSLNSSLVLAAVKINKLIGFGTRLG